MARKIVQTGLDRAIYDAAKQYHLAAHLLDKLDHSLPYLTNLGFAIELYIKCMDVTTETRLDAPAVANLMSKVSIPAGGGVAIDQVAGKSKVKAVLRKGNTHSLIRMFNRHKEYIKEKAANEYQEKYRSSLVNDLTTIGSPFTYWRYYYENESSHTGFLLLENLAEFFMEFAGKQDMRITVVPIESDQEV